MSSYQRTQILLEPDQHSTLVHLAEVEQRSLSEIFRELATRYIKEHLAEQKKQQALQTMAELAQLRAEIASRRTTTAVDVVEQINQTREERILDFERVQRGEE